MNKIIYPIIALMLIILTSATTVSIMTIKPAQPIDVAVVTGSELELRKSIFSLQQRGYIVKSVSAPSYHYKGGIAVLEKY